MKLCEVQASPKRLCLRRRQMACSVVQYAGKAGAAGATGCDCSGCNGGRRARRTRPECAAHAALAAATARCHYLASVSTAPTMFTDNTAPMLYAPAAPATATEPLTSCTAPALRLQWVLLRLQTRRVRHRTRTNAILHGALKSIYTLDIGEVKTIFVL